MQGFIKRPIATLMFFGAFLLLGSISLARLKVSLFPDIVFPRITILTNYPDVSPDEIENLITKPVEDAVSSVNGVKKITSRSEEGLSSVEIQLDWGTSIDMAVINLRQKLDLAKSSLPQDAGKPMLIRFDPSSEPVILLIARPKRVPFDELRDYIDKNILPSFERIEGVASVSITGGRRREIGVNIDIAKLQSYGLTVDHISRALQSANYGYPAGNVKSGEKEFTVRFMGQFENIGDIGNVVVSSGSGGNPVYLHQLAYVSDGFKDQTGTTLYNGNPSILIGLKKEPDKNTVETAQNIRNSLDKISREFGQNVEFEILHDSSLYISDAIASVRNSTIQGGLIAFVILLLFLGDVRTALIIIVSIPVSIMNTFFFMYAGDVSINIMSLGGLSLGTGLQVDNAIVTLESIQNEIDSHRELPLITNVINGTKNITASSISSSLTSVVIFLPIIFVSGIAGEIFRDLAFTVTFSLLSALLSSLTLIPVLASIDITKLPVYNRLMMLNDRIRPASQLIENHVQWIRDKYLDILNYSFDNKRRLINFCILITLIGMLLFIIPEKNLFPEVDTGIVHSTIELPEGASIEESQIYHRRIHKFLLENNLCLHAITNIGYDADDISSLLNGVKKPHHSESACHVNKEKLNSRKFMDVMSESLSLSDGITKSMRIKGDPLQEILGETGNEYRVEIESGNRDHARKLTVELIGILKKIKGIKSMRSSATSLDPEIKISINREKLASNGLYPENVGNTIRNAVQGMVPTVLRQDEKEINIRVRLKPEDRNDSEKLKYLYAAKPDGSALPLRELIEIEEGSGYSGIQRENQKRVENIILEIEDNLNEVSDAVLDFKDRIDASSIHLPAENKVHLTFQKSNQETMDSLLNLVFAFFLSVVLIYQLIAAQFESFIHPLTLALSIPMMFFGVSFALVVTGNGINISSVIGLIMLVGIVVNSSIILYEFTRQNMDERNLDRISDPVKFGISLRKCLIDSCVIRLRPILLTTLTSIFGMLPMVITFGSDPSPQESMAVAVIGGLFTSTILTLIAFPVFFYMVEMRFRKYNSRGVIH